MYCSCRACYSALSLSLSCVFSSFPRGLSFPQYNTNPQHLPTQSSGLTGLDHSFPRLLFSPPFYSLRPHLPQVTSPDGGRECVLQARLCFTSHALAVGLLVVGRGAEGREEVTRSHCWLFRRLLKVTQRRRVCVCVVALVCSLRFIRLSVFAPLPVAVWDELKSMWEAVCFWVTGFISKVVGSSFI